MKEPRPEDFLTEDDYEAAVDAYEAAVYEAEARAIEEYFSLWDENCKKALECLPQLKGCQVHSTVMLSEVDHKIFKKLEIGLTCDPVAKK